MYSGESMAATKVNSISIQDAHIITPIEIQIPNEIQNCTPTQPRWPSLDFLSGENKNVSLSVGLHKAALKGDWETAKNMLGDDPRSILCASITKGYETVLHIAAGARQNGFVEELLKLMEPEDLTLQDRNGNSAFCFAAAAGDIQIARMMLKKNRSLLTIRGGKNVTPLFVAALFARRDMGLFLYNESKDILVPKDQTALYFTCIDTSMFELALKLLEDHAELAVVRSMDDETALHVLARKPSAFARRNLGLWKRLSNSLSGIMKLNYFRDMTSTDRALQFVRRLWEEILNRGDLELTNLIRRPSNFLFHAAELGNFEFLAELICCYPDLVYELDNNNRSILHIAVLHRHADIFNLINEIGFTKELILTFEDNEKNSILHLAAKFPNQSRLNIVSGAALQMQRELLWFKEIEKMVQPSFREKKNSEGQTPQELFTLEHKSLLEKGENWMKHTATSCTLVATLITTIMFTAAFSLPGGNDNDKGLPIHLRETPFQVFVVSDAIALSSSSMAILMFLSILTSRYAENDFLKSLPIKLMVGLSALFISIITMMIAFTTTFFLAYRHRLNWVTMLSTILASVPVTLFVLLQYPLLRDIYCSTYYSKFLFKPCKPML